MHLIFLSMRNSEFESGFNDVNFIEINNVQENHKTIHFMFLSRFRVILANICIIHPDAFLQAKI